MDNLGSIKKSLLAARLLLFIEESAVFRDKSTVLGQKENSEIFRKLTSTERNMHASYQYCNVDGQSIAR
jgi:hypothetical protein